MLDNQDYLTALRTGQNDIKALLHLEPARKVRIAPLLSVTGKRIHTDTFLHGWGNYPFLLDVGRGGLEEQKGILLDLDLNNSKTAFANKRQFFANCANENSNLIPVVGWKPSDPARQLVQCAIKLVQDHGCVAIRANFEAETWKAELNKVTRILDAIPDLERVIIVADRSDRPHELPSYTSGGWVSALFASLNKLGVQKLVNLHTSFPATKPAAGTSDTVFCADVYGHAVLLEAHPEKNYIYGDYAGTNPNEAIEFVPGMVVLPFVSYLNNDVTWFRERAVGDKEFVKFIDLANHLRAAKDYHKDSFCWGTSEIGRISQLTPAAAGGWGTNGTWNGIRINQHVCALLDLIDLGALEANYYTTDDEDDGDDE